MIQHTHADDGNSGVSSPWNNWDYSELNWILFLIEWRGHVGFPLLPGVKQSEKVSSYSASFVCCWSNAHSVKRGSLHTWRQWLLKPCEPTSCRVCCRFLQSGAGAVDACTWHQWVGPTVSFKYRNYQNSEWIMLSRSFFSSSPVIMWMAETPPWRIF